MGRGGSDGFVGASNPGPSSGFWSTCVAPATVTSRVPLSDASTAGAAASAAAPGSGSTSGDEVMPTTSDSLTHFMLPCLSSSSASRSLFSSSRRSCNTTTTTMTTMTTTTTLLTHVHLGGFEIQYELAREAQPDILSELETDGKGIETHIEHRLTVSHRNLNSRLITTSLTRRHGRLFRIVEWASVRCL